MTTKTRDLESQEIGLFSRRDFITNGTLGMVGLLLFPFNASKTAGAQVNWPKILRLLRQLLEIVGYDGIMEFVKWTYNYLTEDEKTEIHRIVRESRHRDPWNSQHKHYSEVYTRGDDGAIWALASSQDNVNGVVRFYNAKNFCIAQLAAPTIYGALCAASTLRQIKSDASAIGALVLPRQQSPIFRRSAVQNRFQDEFADYYDTKNGYVNVNYRCLNLHEGKGIITVTVARHEPNWFEDFFLDEDPLKMTRTYDVDFSS